MSVSRPTLSTIGALAALGFVLGGSALAQWQNSPLMRSFADNWSSTAQNVVGRLASNEGIYVDMKNFKIAKGMAKGDPQGKSQSPKAHWRRQRDLHSDDVRHCTTPWS